MNDPRDLMAKSPMTRLQILVVAITVGLTGLDGFDVLSSSFASPGIAREWGIDRAALGVVLSMDLLGMALGSVFLGGIADYIGRRKTLLGCLALMTFGMMMVVWVHGLRALCVWRIVTGLGIGGMLATNNAVATEFANTRRRDLAVSMMAIGYPLGAIIGGSIAAQLLKSGNWRVVFEFGAICTAVFLPLVYWCVPESVSWLCQKQPQDALSRLNRSLTRLGYGYGCVAQLPPQSRSQRRTSALDIFEPGRAVVTVLLTATYFFHITTFYFMLKWVPKIVVDVGFAPSAAAGVLVWANVGGAAGGAALGLMTETLSLRAMTIATLFGSAVLVALFGQGHVDLTHLSVICALVGFCTNAGVVGIYAVLARAYPTQQRATGTGFAVGVGRGGAMLAPIIAGLLFRAGLGLPWVAAIMATGSMIAVICMAALPRRASQGSSVVAPARAG
ncbi:MAG: MFS transporter [Steroidobacteraceae bacterium]